MRTGLKCFFPILCLTVFGRAEAAIVSLTAPVLVTTIDSEVVLDLTIDYEAGESGSLFSYGARVDLNGTGLVNFVSLSIPAELDFSGPNGPGATTDLSPGVLGVKGTVEALNPPITAYSGSLLAQYRFRFPEVGEFTFTPSEFNTLGPTEDLFVTGDGQVLDDALTFQSVTVTVVPEPSVGVLGLVGVGLLGVFSRRRSAK